MTSRTVSSFVLTPHSAVTEVIVNVLLPQVGLYKLMVYLEPENDKEEKKYVISYLLECTKPFSQRLVFQNYGDKLGVQSMKKGKSNDFPCFLLFLSIYIFFYIYFSYLYFFIFIAILILSMHYLEL